MKKVLVYSFVIAICFAFGCKKDHQDTAVYLLKQRIVDDRQEGAPIDTTTYTYDDQNKVTTIMTGLANNQVTLTFQYDSDNRISIAHKYSRTGTPIIEFDFFYTAEASGYRFFGPTHIADTATFIYNDKKQIIKIQTLHSGSQEFTYDGKGNITSSEGFAVDGSNGLFDKTSYAYDDKKNPFSATPPYNYYFMYIGFKDPSTHINNAVVKNADTYTYTYNSAGFPISASVNTGTAIFPIYYNYIVK
ncbi:MAG TPA: hypothetical protein VK668_07735 [Mucilaginibacter sp.]|nr:hypothetical protein [Mucilaginibacter sp.]